MRIPREGRSRPRDVERGPIVYCAEWPDCEGGGALDLLLDPRAELVPAAEPSLGGGVTVLNTVARRLTKPRGDATPLRLVPYFLWANRGPGQMSVWLATRELVPGDVGPAGGFIFYVNPNYAADGWRYLEAVRSPRAPARLRGYFDAPSVRAAQHRIGVAEYGGHHRRRLRATKCAALCAT